MGGRESCEKNKKLMEKKEPDTNEGLCVDITTFSTTLGFDGRHRDVGARQDQRLQRHDEGFEPRKREDFADLF